LKKSFLAIGSDHAKVVQFMEERGGQRPEGARKARNEYRDKSEGEALSLVG
jgi:hypothetical protein